LSKDLARLGKVDRPEKLKSHAWYSVRVGIGGFHAAGHLSGVYLRFRYANLIEHYRYLLG
jgi:hypothetical protein